MLTKLQIVKHVAAHTGFIHVLFAFWIAGRVADFSDEDEDFSSNEEGEGEGSDSEPMLEERRSRKAKIPVNARVSDKNLSYTKA